MKRATIVFALVFCLVSMLIQGSGAEFKRKRFGLGISVGDPVGMSCKYWLTQKSAFDIALGWQGDDNTYFHIDYLSHNYKSIPKGELTGDIPFYRGIGLRCDRIFTARNDLRLGIRFVLGINYLFEGVPGDIFAELVPTLVIQPDVTAMISASIGARYYFE